MTTAKSRDTLSDTSSFTASFRIAPLSRLKSRATGISRIDSAPPSTLGHAQPIDFSDQPRGPRADLLSVRFAPARNDRLANRPAIQACADPRVVLDHAADQEQTVFHPPSRTQSVGGPC